MNSYYLHRRCPWLRFLEADNGANATTGSADNSVDLGGTPDDVPPSFDGLGQTPAPAVVATEEADAAKAKEEEEAAAREAQEKADAEKAAADAKAAEDEAAKKAAASTENPTDAQKAEAAAAAKKAEDDKAAAEAAEKEKKDEVELPTDEEIEAMQPPPGSSTKTITHFGELKKQTKLFAQAARESQTKLAEAAKQIETLKQSSGGADPKRIKYLERVDRIYNRENSQSFQTELAAKQESVDKGLVDTLKGLGMTDEAIKTLTDGEAKDADGRVIKGLDRFDDAWWEKNIKVKLADRSWQKVLRALEDRASVPEWKQKQLDAIAADAEALGKEGEAAQQKQVEGWSGALQAAVGKLSEGQEWCNMKEIPANATKEQKAALEAHNAEVAKHAETYKATVIGLWNKVPDVCASAAFAVEQVPLLQAKLEASTTANAELQKRVDELEAIVGKARGVGKMTTRSDTNPPPPRKSTAKGIDLGGTSEEVKPDFDGL